MQTTKLSHHCKNNLTCSFLASSRSVEVVVPLYINTAESPSILACTSELEPFSPFLRVCPLPPLASSARKHISRSPLITLPGKSSLQKSQVFYLCCMTIRLRMRPRVASQHGCLRECGLRRRRKPNLSSILRGKIAPHLLIIAFFRSKGWRSNRHSGKHERCSCCRN